MLGVRKVAKFVSDEATKLDRHLNYLSNNKMAFSVSCYRNHEGKFHFIVVWWDNMVA